MASDVFYMADFPEQFAWRVARLVDGDRLRGFLRCIPRAHRHGMSQPSVQCVDLDVVLVDGALAEVDRIDFSIPDVPDLLERIISGFLSLNGRTYSLEWQDAATSQALNDRYELSTWRRDG